MSILSDFSLEGRKAVVTGAGSGIGRAIAVGLAEAGADVVAAGRTRDALDAVVGEITSLGRKGLAATVDVSDEASVTDFRDNVEEAFGPVQILVNSAGITVRKPVLELSLAEWDEVIRTNLTGCFLTARAFGPTLIRQGWGRVINLSSIRLSVTSAGLAAYAASKGAIVPLTKTLALEWVEHGVTANAIAPGYVDTPLVEYVKDLPRSTRTPCGRFRWAGGENRGRSPASLSSWPQRPPLTSPAKWSS